MATIKLRHTQKYYHLVASDLFQKDYWLVNVDIDKQFYDWLQKRDDENFEKLNPHSKLFVEGVHYKEL